MSTMTTIYTINYGSFFSFSSIGLALGWGLGYFGQPHILTNFMGIDDPKKIPYAKYIGISWQIIVLTAAICIGIIGTYYFKDPTIAAELIFVHMAKDLFPLFIAGFAVCGIFAATLSSMDSLILIAGNTCAEDIYKAVLHKNASSKTILLVSRIASIVISLLALFVARNNSDSVYNLVYYAWSGLGSAFGPLLLATFYWKGTNKYGAIAGMITGALVSGSWGWINSSILPLLPGFAVSTIAIVLASFITKKKSLQCT